MKRILLLLVGSLLLAACQGIGGNETRLYEALG